MIDLTFAPDVLPGTDLMTASAPPRPAARDREGTAMLLHEALARCRQQEAERAARDHAAARAITAGRSWSVLARFAARRAARARSVAVPPDTGYAVSGTLRGAL